MKSAPFTDEEIKHINEYQCAAYMHPLTCTCGNHIRLIATKDGLICSNCGRLQTWVHEWIANGSWKI